MKKADTVWDHYITHILEVCNHPTTLKDLIRALRTLEIDVDALKTATAAYLEEYEMAEIMAEYHVKRLFMLISNPSTPSSQPCM